MTTKQALGIVVEARREDLGLSQKQLAELTGMTEKRIRNIERGTGRVLMGTIFDLARGLKMPPSAIVELAGRTYEKHEKKKGR